MTGRFVRLAISVVCGATFAATTLVIQAQSGPSLDDVIVRTGPNRARPPVPHILPRVLIHHPPEGAIATI